jgi:hypothetical protein
MLDLVAGLSLAKKPNLELLKITERDYIKLNLYCNGKIEV